ncbi:hypothetical protein [Burkholderia pseudomallei]|nr:hypothetical protein [Burkholderia pseudomallei]
MKTLAIHAMYRLRVAMQLGAISRTDWLRRARRINARFGAPI